MGCDYAKLYNTNGRFVVYLYIIFGWNSCA